MDCERCGEGLPPSFEEGGESFWTDGDTIRCGCGTVSRISVDEDGDVWVQGWTCKHGADDETPCPACDAEDEAARAPGKEDRHE